MKIALVIDSLNSGGAQRQMAMLALLLKKAQHDVTLFRYRQRDFFLPLLEGANIEIVDAAAGRFSRIWDMRRKVRGFQPKVAIAFLPTPNLLLELAGIPKRNFGVIVSERNSRIGKISLRDRLSLNLHRLADALVTNSHDTAKVIEGVAPRIERKTHVITNCVDLEKFKPRTNSIVSGVFEFSVLARFHKNKNALGMADAVRIVTDRLPKGTDFVVNWYGNNFYRDGQPTDLSQNYDEVTKRIRELNIENRLVLHPPSEDVASIYQKSSAIILPSFVEGCSNVICEALACGRPVLTSNVCDNPLWVRHGENGLLFDPYDPNSIAESILEFMKLAPAAQDKMGQNGRAHAERELSNEVFLARYLNVINKVAAKY